MARCAVEMCSHDGTRTVECRLPNFEHALDGQPLCTTHAAQRRQMIVAMLSMEYIVEDRVLPDPDQRCERVEGDRGRCTYAHSIAVVVYPKGKAPRASRYCTMHAGTVAGELEQARIHFDAMPI